MLIININDLNHIWIDGNLYLRENYVDRSKFTGIFINYYKEINYFKDSIFQFNNFYNEKWLNLDEFQKYIKLKMFE